MAARYLDYFGRDGGLRFCQRGKRDSVYLLIEATTAFSEHRLPELFAGYVRREHSKLVPYPLANSPQAWASGSIIYSLETLLGLSVSVVA